MSNIDELRNLLIKAKQEYYNNSDPIMSDEEYDNLENQLKNLSPNDKFFDNIGSPIQTTEWKKSKHLFPMMSLNKAKNMQELEHWIFSNNIQNEMFALMYKLDGISIEIIYKNGKLIEAVTRGDGFEGESISSNVIKMQNVKQTINNFTGSLRGEIILKHSDFKKINQILLNNNEKQMKNCRNAASGIAKRYDGKFSEYLTVLYYNIINGNIIDKKSIFECFENQINLEPVWYRIIDFKKIQYIYEEYIKERDNIDMDIDGLVIEINNIEKYKSLGKLGENPNGAIALKFPPIIKTSIVKNVTWQVGNNGTITPICNIEPVSIGGITVENASLANFNIFKEMNLNYGDVVNVSRRNEVIPHIEGIVKKGNGISLDYPKYCPICNTETKIDGKFLICDNPNCKALKIGNIIKWINALNIMDVSDKTIELLYVNYFLKEVYDLYTLNAQKLIQLDRMGDRSVEKLLKNLKENMIIPLNIFIEGLNIEDFSNSRAELLMSAGFDTIEKMQLAKIEELTKIKGIEQKTANKIVNGLKAKKEIITKLIEVGIVIKEEIKQEVQMNSNKLNGKSYCFTGKIEKIDENGERYTREKMQNLVIENGGTVLDSVKNGLSYLVQADPSSQSSKTQKAIKLNVQIISEKQFFEMIEK